MDSLPIGLIKSAIEKKNIILLGKCFLKLLAISRGIYKKTFSSFKNVCWPLLLVQFRSSDLDSIST